MEAAGYELSEAEELGVKHPLAKAIVVIDEAGDYFPAEPPKEQQEICRKTARWLAKVRHEGARVIFCCQNDMQICAPVRRLIGFQIHLTDLGEWVEPLFGCLVSDWFQVASKFLTGRPIQWVKEEEFVGNGQNLDVMRVRRWFLTKRYFALYNSRNRAGGRTGERKRDEWEVLHRFEFLRWFIGKNAFGLARAAAAVLLAGVLLWPGYGIYYAFMYVYHSVVELVETANAEKSGAEKSAPESGVAESKTAKDGLEKGEKQRVSAAGAAAVQQDAGPRLVMISSKNFVTDDGGYYEVGDLVYGQMVMRLDVLRGEVLLDGGGRLRLGHGLREPIAAEERGSAIVQRSLRGAQRSSAPANGGDAGVD